MDGRDTSYSLKMDPEVIAKDILKRLEKHVLPVFEKLSSREAVLQFRRDYPDFDDMNRRLILLEEAMIYGRRGDLTTAAALFNQYYRNVLAEYEQQFAHGKKTFLHKGECVTYLNRKTGQTESIVAEETGYVTLYNANRGHLDVLEKLAVELGISLDSPE